ncbi:MAG: FecR domain-containing protein, partial [Anaerolineae bacterium]
VESRTVVKEGDTIQTDTEGSAMLVWFEDGTLVELGPNTHVVITTFQISPDQYEIEFKLLQGRVLNAVNKLRNPESRYQIVTPSVQLAVRGTQFAVDVQPDTTTTLVVHEGLVAAQQGDTEVDVPAGFYLQTSADGAIAAPAPINTGDQAVHGLYGDIQTFVEDLLPDAIREVEPSAAVPSTDLANPQASAPLENTTVSGQVENITAPLTNTLENVTAPVTTVVEATTATTSTIVTEATTATTQVTEAVTAVVDTVPLVGEEGLDVGQTVEDTTTATTETVTATVETTVGVVNEATNDLTETLTNLLNLSRR